MWSRTTVDLQHFLENSDKKRFCAGQAVRLLEVKRWSAAFLTGELTWWHMLGSVGWELNMLQEETGQQRDSDAEGSEEELVL